MKGQGLPTETIIILILVVIVAVAVVIFFTTGMAQSGGDINTFGQSAAGDTNVRGREAACNIACINYGFADTSNPADGECDNTADFCKNNNCPIGYKCTSMQCAFPTAGCAGTY